MSIKLRKKAGIQSQKQGFSFHFTLISLLVPYESLANLQALSRHWFRPSRSRYHSSVWKLENFGKLWTCYSISQIVPVKLLHLRKLEFCNSNYNLRTRRICIILNYRWKMIIGSLIFFCECLKMIMGYIFMERDYFFL